MRALVGGRRISRAISLAAVAVAAVGAPVAHASGSRAAPPRVELRGTVSPLVAKGQAHVVGTPRATAQVTAVVAFKPRNAILLHWLAEHSSGRPAMSNAQIHRLFTPRPATIAAVRSYVSSYGLSVVDSSDMSLVVSGTAAAADRAFGVSLRLYQDARGTTYRAPSRNVRLPKGIASVVSSVDGLDSSLVAHPHYRIARHLHGTAAPKVGIVPHDVTGCNAAQNKQNNANAGFLPGDLAAAYHYDTLIGATNDGSNQKIGFVEFTNYNRNDAVFFRQCFTGINGHYPDDVSIGGGPSDHFGQVEVNLDLEVAMGAAPDATWQVYKAGNNVALLPTMLAHMRNDGMTIVSDSWGLCELFMPIKLTANENTALELNAVAGVSFYQASGDDGSADCRAANPVARFLAIDDPSGQPFATAVGGTNLRAPPHGSFLEKGWKGSGGGISINWPKPKYQNVTGVPDEPGGFCSSGPAHCRVTPDIAMDAAPQTGYIIRSRGLGSGGTPVWGIVGGTSGAAPLAAAITADANESAGQNLGFANPFIYKTLVGGSGGDFNDVLTGSNANGTAPFFSAHMGWDHVTGWGSLIGTNFANALATYVATPPVFHHTKLTGTHPLNNKRVTRGKLVDFTGRLTDKDAGGGIANRQIIVIGNGNIIGVDRTSSNGVWEIKFKVKKRLSWHATFMGSDTQRPAFSPTHTVRIRH